MIASKRSTANKVCMHIEPYASCRAHVRALPVCRLQHGQLRLLAFAYGGADRHPTSTLGTMTASESAVDSTAVVTTCSLNAATLLPMLGITRLMICTRNEKHLGCRSIAYDGADGTCVLDARCQS